MNDVIIKRTRPERFTEFLSHMFPTERDRLYFEIAMQSCCLGFSDDRVRTKHIELVMPNNKFLLRLDPLYVVEIFSDGNNPDEILEDRFEKCDDPIVVDLCNTGKSKNKQLEFINRLCGVKYKIKKQTKEKELNTNLYVFAVKKSLYKDNGNFRSYTLTNYNDDNYNFTEVERYEYDDYLTHVCYDIRNIIIDHKMDCRQLDEVIDIYYKEINKTEQKTKQMNNNNEISSSE